jgi:hypothetical protein
MTPEFEQRWGHLASDVAAAIRAAERQAAERERTACYDDVWAVYNGFVELRAAAESAGNAYAAGVQEERAEAVKDALAAIRARSRA